MVLLYIIQNKFRSTLAKIAHIYTTTQLFQYIRILFWGTPFLPKKNPRRARRRPSKVGWSYPIAFRSLVVRHTARTQNFPKIWQIFELFQDHLGCTQNWSNFDTFDTFSQNFQNTFCSQNDHINDLELSFSAPFSKCWCTAFPCSKKHGCSWFWMILVILWFWAQGPWGPWDPSFFDIFWKCILWSGIYLEVFVWCLGAQGTP